MGGQYTQELDGLPGYLVADFCLKRLGMMGGGVLDISLTVELPLWGACRQAWFPLPNVKSQWKLFLFI